MLQQPFALVGRDPRADILLDHSLVSRRHVYLQVVGGDVFWIDLDSRSGTFSDGQLQSTGWLDRGRLIRVGPFGLERLQSTRPSRENQAGTRISPLIARSLGDSPLPEVSLEFLNGPSRSTNWPMNRVMSLVGSTSGCKFRLDDPSVAPFHCCLVRTWQGLWVVDLLGQDGLGVNDAPQRCALLSDKDVLRIGRYRIKIHSRFSAGESEATTTTRRGDISTKELVARPRAPVAPVMVSHFHNATIPNDINFASLVGRLASMQPPAQLPSPDWLTAGNEPVLVEKGNISESLLVSVVNQFGVMQQQMLDQFQQTVSMLVQTFGNLHREQMDTIREELDQIRDLTREFQVLKLELDARGREQSTAVPAGVKPRVRNAPVEDSSESESGQKSPIENGPSILASALGHADGPEDSACSLLRRGSIPAAPSSAQAAGETTDHANRLHQAARRQQAVAEQKPESERDMVVWLHQRMVHLQQERETRWQKILKLLPGIS